MVGGTSFRFFGTHIIYFFSFFTLFLFTLFRKLGGCSRWRTLLSVWLVALASDAHRVSPTMHPPPAVALWVRGWTGSGCSVGWGDFMTAATRPFLISFGWAYGPVLPSVYLLQYSFQRASA